MLTGFISGAQHVNTKLNELETDGYVHGYNPAVPAKNSVNNIMTEKQKRSIAKLATVG